MRLLLAILLLILMSCNRRDRYFEKLDISIIDGYRGFYSVKIFPDKRAYFLYEIYHKDTCVKKMYYKSFINNNQCDSISEKIKVIQSLNVDTLYNCICIDCGNSSVVIKTKNKIIKTFMIGNCSGDETTNKLNDLVSYVLRVVKKERECNDSLFIFESRTKQFLPPSSTQ